LAFQAVITPVSKISNPKELSDFRPISVTPSHLALLNVPLSINMFLPTLPVEMLAGQFAYRATCSTSAAPDDHVAQ